jgi:hypothetical protein
MQKGPRAEGPVAAWLLLSKPRTNQEFVFLKMESKMSENAVRNEAFDSSQPVTSLNAGGEQPRAWEMIENGRYQPRRIKGSCLGRELG